MDPCVRYHFQIYRLPEEYASIDKSSVSQANDQF